MDIYIQTKNRRSECMFSHVEPVIEGSFDYYKITFPITQKTTQKTTQKILELIRNNPKITRKELAKKIGNITEDGIKYNIEKLKKEGKIKRVGPAKGGHWEVKKEK
jgi:predicted HTH transcriptional regulator